MNKLFPLVAFSILLLVPVGVQNVSAVPPAPGDIIVTDGVNNGLWEQNPAGGPPTSIFLGAPYLGPIGVVVDPATGDLIVSDNNFQRGIYRQSPAGGAPLKIGTGGPPARLCL